MSQPLSPGLGSFAFVPWLRRGAARFIGAGASPQTLIAVALQVGSHPVTSPPLALRGPGDIIGFDANAICRTWPQKDATGVEPEYLALVEFDQADLPWRFTPAAAVGDQLAPWLCLIVAAEGEFDPVVPPITDRPLATVTITAAAALPNLAQSTGWAHAEAIGETSLDGAGAAALMQASPQLLRSRILCPRQLSPNTSYNAFLVPGFELGRLGGLRLPTAGVAVSTPAWSTAPVTLPVYYQWTFSTGDPGDFSELVRELQPNPLPDAVAYRDMDVSEVSRGTAPIGMEGALTTAAHPVKDLPAADAVKVASTYGMTLAPTPPAVRPPMYGSAYVGATPPPWYQDLSTDPRTRAAAGLGAELVRKHADALLAGAWAQAAGLRDANQQLRQLELSRELARSLWVRHAPSSSPDVFISFVAPLATRVATGATTLYETVRGSVVTSGCLSAALRRLTRPLGPIALRQARQNDPALLSKMSSGSWLGSAASFPVSARAVATSAMPGVRPAAATAVSGVSTGIATGRLGPATGLFGVGNPVATLKGIADPSGLAMAAATLVGQLTTPPKPGATLKALNLLKLQNTLAGQIDPVAAIDAQAHARTVRNDGRSGAAPFVVAPSFSQAMSAWLAAMSPAWLLPGLSQVLPNSLALVAVNRRFVEAFMAGLNHEMGRRLIFDEFPTDVAATFFKSFWNDGADDIAPVGTWGVLGYNPPLGAPVGDPLVLVVRGALVRRYPNIQVLAVQATSAGPTRTLGGTETPALFSCRIDPDVAFYGFPLTVEDALGTATTPGYYIVIQEHPSEPRFGGAIPAGSSAAIAAALLQHPVRLAVYAADLLQGVAGGGH